MKNNDTSTKKEEPIQVKEQWGFYFSKNRDATTALNLALKEIAPIKDKPNLALVTLRAKDPQTDNPSYLKETETLSEIEFAIAKEVKADSNSIHIGRYTGVRNKTIYFYCNDTDLFNETVSNVLEGFADYEFEIDFHVDKEWKGYFGIYPSEWQFQSMGNMHIITQLIKMGDQLSEPREVEHIIFFKSKTDRKRFLKKFEKQGFNVVDKFFEDSKKEHPYGLVVSRVDQVDWKVLMNTCYTCGNFQNNVKGFTMVGKHIRREVHLHRRMALWIILKIIKGKIEIFTINGRPAFTTQEQAGFPFLYRINADSSYYAKQINK